MHEQPPRESKQAGHDAPDLPAQGGPWDASEQVSDIHQVEGTGDGRIEQAEKLRERPSIWVGSWLDYNNGVLYGDWIHADRDDDEIWADIQTMLAGSPTAAQTGDVAEDWGVFDYDNFGNVRIGEQEAVSWIGAVARGISEHGPAFAAYADVMEEESALGGFTDAFLGQYDSVEQYAEQLIDDLGYDRLLDESIPGHLRPYVQIDVAALARDMQIGGDIATVSDPNGGVWIFDARN